MSGDSHVFERAKWKFTDEENAELARTVTQKVKEIETLEDEKKSATAQMNADIKRAKLDCATAAQKHRDGWEFRDTECRVEKDYDTKVVRYIRIDEGTVVRQRKMYPEELQEKLDLDESIEAAKVENTGKAGRAKK